MASEEDCANFYKEMRNPEISPGGARERMEMYAKWADKYEQLSSTHFETNSALNVARRAVELLGENKDVQILDVGAGTGRVGVHLHKNGFHNLDAMDGCSAMLVEAKKKGVYSRLICDLLGADKMDVPDATYDCVTLAGTFAPNHANDTCFEEVIRILKPGGQFVFNISESYLEFPDFKDRFRPRIQMLSDQGVWKVISCDRREYTRKLNEDWTMSLLYCVQKL